MTHSDSWLENYEALKAHVAQTGHFTNKHTRQDNWCRYQRKRIKAGTMPQEQQTLFEAWPPAVRVNIQEAERRKLKLRVNS